MLADLIATARPREVVCVPAGTHQETVVIDKSLTLVGEAASILAGDGDSAIVVSRPVNLHLEELVFRGGEAWAGGAVFLTAGASLTIDRCRFEANCAPPFGGGALYADSGRIQVRRSVFLANEAPRGAAVFADGSAIIDLYDCLLAGDGGDNGLVYAREASRLRLVHCTVIAEGDSTAIRAHGSTTRQPSLVIHNSVIQTDGGVPVTGSEGVYRPQVSVRHSLLSRAMNDSVLARDADSLVGVATFVADNPALGLAPGTSGTGLADTGPLPAPFEDEGGGPNAGHLTVS